MVDVRNDAKIPDILHVLGPVLGCAKVAILGGINLPIPGFNNAISAETALCPTIFGKGNTEI